MRALNLIVKRLIDILGSLFGIILLSPFLIIISVLIKTTSKGPVFFKQNRLGAHGKVFKIIKFRSMVCNAENIGDGLRVYSGGDSRITKVGKVLRDTSIDELPQLFNVFIGNMSLVGPRPPVTYHPYEGYESYPEWAKKRFLMKPGITGLSQILVRNSVSWDDRIIIDLKYIESFNILLDIKILLLTLKRVFKRKNIYKTPEYKEQEAVNAFTEK